MKPEIIQQKIFEIRGEKVMLDFDLAALYGVDTRILNQAVKRNPDKFPRDFMFRLTSSEWKLLRSQNVIASTSTSNMRSHSLIASQKKRNTSVTPYAFTEHGVTMVATILKSKKAVKMSIAVVRAFIALKQFVLQHKDLSAQLKELRQELYDRLGEHDTQLAAIYDAIENLLDEKAEKKSWEERERIGFKK
jgi:phage regulator Rha-like protein